MKDLKKIFSSLPIIVNSPEEMRDLGAQLAPLLEPGDVIGLVGDLGVGKTHLVQGIFQGLGSEEIVISPTFSIVNEYNEEKLCLAHFDFYRLEDPLEAFSLGWDEYLTSERILIVEWANQFDGELMPSHTLWITIKYTGHQTRRVFVN